MQPNQENTRELGVGESLRVTDFVFMDDDDQRRFISEYIPVTKELDGYILDGSEDYTYVRIKNHGYLSPLEALMDEYQIDNPIFVDLVKRFLCDLSIANARNKLNQ